MKKKHLLLVSLLTFAFLNSFGQSTPDINWIRINNGTKYTPSLGRTINVEVDNLDSYHSVELQVETDVNFTGGAWVSVSFSQYTISTDKSYFDYNQNITDDELDFYYVFGYLECGCHPNSSVDRQVGEFSLKQDDTWGSITSKTKNMRIDFKPKRYGSMILHYRAAFENSPNNIARDPYHNDNGGNSNPDTFGYQSYEITLNIIRSNTSPTAPVLAAPPHQGPGAAVEGSIIWYESYDADDDPITYDVYFGTSSNPPFVTTTTSTSYDPPGNLDYDEKYYWKIVAKDNNGGSATGGPWNFTTEENADPTKPSSITAIDITENSAEITWGNSSDDDNHNIIYDLRWEKNNTLTWNTITNVSKPYNLTGLEEETTYAVEMKARDAYGGDSGWTSQYNFTTFPEITKVKSTKPSNENNFISDVDVDRSSIKVFFTENLDINSINSNNLLFKLASGNSVPVNLEYTQENLINPAHVEIEFIQPLLGGQYYEIIIDDVIDVYGRFVVPETILVQVGITNTQFDGLEASLNETLALFTKDLNLSNNQNDIWKEIENETTKLDELKNNTRTLFNDNGFINPEILFAQKEGPFYVDNSAYYVVPVSWTRNDGQVVNSEKAVLDGNNLVLDDELAFKVMLTYYSYNIMDPQFFEDYDNALEWINALQLLNNALIDIRDASFKAILSVPGAQKEVFAKEMVKSLISLDNFPSKIMELNLTIRNKGLQSGFEQGKTFAESNGQLPRTNYFNASYSYWLTNYLTEDANLFVEYTDKFWEERGNIANQLQVLYNIAIDRLVALILGGKELQDLKNIYETIKSIYETPDFIEECFKAFDFNIEYTNRIEEVRELKKPSLFVELGNSTNATVIAELFYGNIAPKIISTPIALISEGELYDYLIEFVDDDGDPVVITALTKPNWLSLEFINNEVRLKGDSMDEVGFHNVTLMANDGNGGITYQTFIIEVISVNSNPTDIVLSNNTIDENLPIGTQIGLIIITDPDVGDSHTLSLVAGLGDNDNSLFTISNNKLLTNEAFDFELNQVFTIRLEVLDSEQAGFNKQFFIYVNDVNENNDDDSDGIDNTQDLCPGTPLNTDVDEFGCPIEGTKIVSFNPDSDLLFGQVILGNEKEKTIAITNIGTSNIEITSIAINGQNINSFEVSNPFSGTLQSNQSIDVTVICNPQDEGTLIASLEVWNDSDNTSPTKIINLKGTGFDNDKDNDGSPIELDCDDNDDTIYPGAPELCDGKDNDCNDLVDDGIDADNDGVCDDEDQCNGFDDNLDDDNDNVPNGCDVCTGNDALGDSDGDNVCDDIDQCPNTPNGDNVDDVGCTIPEGLTYVPDDNFEYYLETHDATGNQVSIGDSSSLGDGIEGNDYVLTVNITSVTHLDLRNKNISDLTGIEDFSSLTYLDCDNNPLININLTQNSALTHLKAYGTLLTNIDLTQNLALSYLYIPEIQLSSLDLTKNTYLEFVNIRGIPLATLDVSQNISLKTLYCSGNITTLDTSQNIALDNLDCSSPLLNSLILPQGNNVLKTLICNGTQLTNIDLSQSHLLETISLDNNQLTGLDVTNKIELTNLSCSQNQIGSLDVSSNSSLTLLHCWDNQLTTLNMKNGNNNILTNFSATQNPDLTCIEVDDSAWSITNWTIIDAQTSFSEDCSVCVDSDNDNVCDDVDQCPGFDDNLDDDNDNVPNGCDVCTGDDSSGDSDNDGICDDLDQCPNTPENDNIDDVGCTIAGWTYVPDNNFEQALIDLGYDTGIPDDYVPTANIENETSLDVSNKGISDLTGIEDFIGLTILRCNNNNLSSLDISNNTDINELHTSNNAITELDFNFNTSLNTIDVTHNLLESIDLSNNTTLQEVRVSYNPSLQNLNLKNGNNTNISVFFAIESPSLNCIQVDDVQWSASNWMNIDAHSSFSEDCSVGQLTYVPDDNFEQALIDLGYDIGVPDDYVPTINIENINILNVENKGINNLIGIEDFISLTNINFADNNITNIDLTNNLLLTTIFGNTNNISNLDVSQNTSLTSLYLLNNSLTNLNLSANIVLDRLNIGGNPLGSLDVTNNVNLTMLSCPVTGLQNLDVSNNPKLIYIYCYSNNIEELNLSNNQALTHLYCHNNNLEKLDVSQNVLISNLVCWGNNINSLNLSLNTELQELNCRINNLNELFINNGNNTILTNFNSSVNPNLTCIEVDDATWSSSNWTNIDVQTSFSEDCNPQLVTLIPDSNFEQQLIDLAIDTDGQLNGQVFTNDILGITNLDISFKNIGDLAGIEDFSSLEVFNCSGNQLIEFDVSSNSSLTSINCSSNQIVSLDLSNNINLQTVWVHDNNLSELNLRNGNNTAISDFGFRSFNNTSLYCIQVDDAYWSGAHWYDNLGSQHYFSEDCFSNNSSLPAKVFLQGSYNPNTGLMSDGMREAGLLPTTSPYIDAVTTNINVFNDGGASGTGDPKDNIVDWIWVELRTNKEGNAVSSGSALLQADGDIVMLDGVSPFSLNVQKDSYYIAIAHRNHLGVITADSRHVLNDVIYLNLTLTSNLLEGGSNAIKDMGDGNFALYAADFDGNGQIQNSDLNGILPLLGTSSYSFADLDMNGQIQNTDINLLLPNLGLGSQGGRYSDKAQPRIIIIAPRR